jgi:hypothetical protein
MEAVQMPLQLHKKNTLVVATKLLRSRLKEMLQRKNMLVVKRRFPNWRESVTLPKRNILAVVIRLLRSKAKEMQQSQLMRVVVKLLLVPKRSTLVVVTKLLN